MTIKEAQEAVDRWIKEYGVRYFSELTNMACLTEEVGELARPVSTLPKPCKRASRRRPIATKNAIKTTPNYIKNRIYNI